MQLKDIYFTTIGDCGVDIYTAHDLKLPGGTALNSAIYAAKAGAKASIISAVGTDELAQIPLEALQEHKINIDQLSIIEGQTDKVDITLDEHSRPEYSQWELGVLDGFTLENHHQKFLATQQMAIAVHLPELKLMFDSFSEMDLPKTIKVADFTDLSEYKGDIAVIEKYINSFSIVALSIDAQDKDRLADYYDLLDTHNKMGIALMGKDGSAFYSEGSLLYQKALDVKALDTTGAGDAYLSTFLIEFIKTHNAAYSMDKATEVASKVIQRIGAI